MNSAYVAALASREYSVLTKLALAVLRPDEDGIRLIARYFSAIQLMGTDKPILEEEPMLSLLLRLSQFLLLATRNEDQTKARNVWARLQREIADYSNPIGSEVFEVMALTKALMLTSGRFPIPDVVKHLARLYELSTSSDYEEVRDVAMIRPSGEEVYALGILFVMHAQAVPTILQSLELFRGLDSQSADFRAQIFPVLELPGFDAEVFISGPWVKEFEAKTIDAVVHAPVYAEIAALCRSWRYDAVAIAAIRFEAIILDEYGNDPDAAIQCLQDALTWASEGNWELRRGLAKIHFRAKRYEVALPLYRELAIGPMSGGDVEAAYMLREAGISASSLGMDIEGAQFFTDARVAALRSPVEAMPTMATGLLGESALAKWRAGDRAGFVQDFQQGLKELLNIPTEGDLRGRHCHFAFRVTLQRVLNQLDSESDQEPEVTELPPGIMCNTEPSSELETRALPDDEMPWYMLAAVELKAGLPITIQPNLNSLLHGGPTYIGEAYLNDVMIDTLLTKGDIPGLASAIERHAMLATIAFAARNSDPFDESKLLDQLEAKQLPEELISQVSDSIQLLILGSAISYLAIGSSGKIEELFKFVGYSNSILVSEDFRVAVGQGISLELTPRIMLALRLRQYASLKQAGLLDPSDLAHLQFLILYLTQIYSLKSETQLKLLDWVRTTWVDATTNQAFLLQRPTEFVRRLSDLQDDRKAAMTSIAKIVKIAFDHIADSPGQDVREILSRMAAGQ